MSDTDLEQLLEELAGQPEIDDAGELLKRSIETELTEVSTSSDEPVESLPVESLSAEPLVSELLPEPTLLTSREETEVQIPGSTPLVDLPALVAQHNLDYARIRKDLETDRDRIKRVLAVLETRLQTSNASDTETESLVKALDVLSRTNDSAVRLLESQSRLLSASKGSAQVFMQNVQGSSEDLRRALAQPLAPDELQ